MALHKINSSGFQIIFALLGVAVNFIEYIRVSFERAEAGFGAEINCPAAIFDAREIRRVGIAKDASAQRNEAFGYRFSHPWSGFTG